MDLQGAAFADIMLADRDLWTALTDKPLQVEVPAGAYNSNTSCLLVCLT